MAKNNMLLGYARGKVGDLVFQRRKGEQIVKARNRNPNNPRTWSQQMQRVRMYAPVAFYKMAVERFFKFAFEDKKPNETDYNAFIRENLNAFQGPYFTKEQVAQKFPVMAPYVISSGTLSSIPGTILETTTYLVIKVPLGTNEIGTENANQGNLSRLLINKYNLQEGDMLTFIIIEISGITIGENGRINYSGETNFDYANFIIDTTSTQPIPNITNLENKGFGLTTMGGESEERALGYKINKERSMQNAVANAIIVTRRSNSKIHASKTSLQLNSNAQNYFEALSTSQQLIIAAGSYGAENTALDPHAAKVMNEATSQINDEEGRSTKQTALNCLPNSGTKNTSGIQPFTLDNECPSCECPIPEPEPCGCNNEEIQQTSRSGKSRRSSINAES